MSRDVNDQRKFTLNHDLNYFLFGRNLEDTLNANPVKETQLKSGNGASFFERVLMSPGSRPLIELVWEKMELSSRKEVWNMVRSTSNRKANDSKNLSTEKLSWAILVGVRHRIWRRRELDYISDPKNARTSFCSSQSEFESF